jgi:ubiquinone/menaquinone biosynthesis C-methylase UbiE/uncharacterized protein YbaR (Trm112 family)
MSTKIQSNRWLQALAWAVAILFVLGFFLPLVGAWTGPILGVWFVGTQRPRRGFLWLVAFAFIPSLVWHWRQFPLTGAAPALPYVGGMLVAAVAGVLPLLFHRLVSPRLPGLLSTLPFPLAAVALHIPPAPAIGVRGFLVCWFAAVVIWTWNHGFRASGIAVGAIVFAAAAALPATLLAGSLPFAWICCGGAFALIWAPFHRRKQQAWADRPDAVAALRSPYTGDPLQLAGEGGREALVSASGERFPIRDGIPVFLKPEDLTGANLKYNRLYETIGGFYDDTQRVAVALAGMNRDAYVMSYLGLLEIKPGDSVLETSVGTGLNFKYLPRGIRRSGLDLSAEMLINCQANLRRWEMDADLFQGNAESLPFADASFDVVFHVGGINFFSDRAKAIREMIRVAKPGSLILIADETEEHVKGYYERTPIASGYYRGRTEKVTAPIDLLPAEMQEVRLQSIFNGRLYALTFRKPAAPATASPS